MMTEKKFIDLYQRQKESGLTVKEFCSNELIAPATFYRWKKLLNDKNRLPGFIPVVLNSSSPVLRDEFSSPHQQETVPEVEIEFSNKTIIRVKSNVQLSFLKALIHLND